MLANHMHENIVLKNFYVRERTVMIKKKLENKHIGIKSTASFMCDGSCEANELDKLKNRLTIERAKTEEAYALNYLLVKELEKTEKELEEALAVLQIYYLKQKERR